MTNYFPVGAGVRQGAFESPIVFNIYLDLVLRVIRNRLVETLGDQFGIEFDFQIPGEVSTREMRAACRNRGKLSLTELLYADDAAMFFKSRTAMSTGLQIIHSELARFGLILSLPKTETMVVNDDDSGEQSKPTLVSFEGFDLKNTQEFKYLGLMTSTTNESKFLQHRIAMALSKFASLKPLLTDQRIAMGLRLKFLNSFVRSRLTYSAATWNLKESQISEMEVIWCRLLRRMIRRGFARKDDFSMIYSNKRVYEITGAYTIESYLRRQQLRWVGHVCRMQNASFQKQLLFSKTKKHQRDIWPKLEKITNLDRSQLQRMMMKRTEFVSLLDTLFD